MLSPDGRFLAYLSDVSGRLEAYVDSFPAPSHARRVDTGGAARQVAFRADGRELFVLADIGTTASLFVIPLRPGRELEMERPQKLFSLPPEWLAFAPAPVGDRFYLAVRLGSRSPSLTLVENWHAQLESKP
jgi:hypothetical protein